MLTFIFIYLFSFSVSGQERHKYRITQVPIPSSNVRCLLEDSKGFLWIGTQDGLFRFDSQNSKQFNKNGNYKNNIGGSDIRDMAESKDAVWITSTQGGLDKISEITSIPLMHLPQSRFPGLGSNTVTSLLNLDTAIYIGTEKGLYLYNVLQNEVSTINLGNGFKDGYVDKLALFNNYMIVFLRNWGCISYDIKNKKLSGKVKTVDNNILKVHRFYSIARYSEFQWLLGTSKGINLISLNEYGQFSFEKRPFTYVKESINEDIYSIEVDKNRNVWFSTENNLFNIEPALTKYSVIDNTLENSVDFLNNVYRIYCDKENNIWLGCQSGLFYLKNVPSLTTTYHKSSTSLSEIAHAYYLYPVSDSIVFVTAENGLYKVNIDSNIIEEVDVSQVYDFVFYDPYRKLIVSNKTGLNYLLNNKLIPILNIYPEFKNFSNYTINSAVKINNSEIAMSTENNKGILIWNFVKHFVQNITTTSYGLKLDNNIINGVFRIKENVFCVLTESSLIYIDWKRNVSKRIHFVKDKSPEEYALFFDMCRIRDHYYLSSYGNGVLVLDTNYHVSRIISKVNGLSNNSVYKLLPWKDSLLFMTTNFGLNILDVKSGYIQQLYKSDGLHDNAFEETSGNIYKNLIYAGGQNGFTIINPENLQPNKSPPLLYIDKITFNFPNNVFKDTSDLSATQFSIDNHILQTNIYFSGINYSNPERTIYAYRISEFQKDWINLENRNFVTLMGLPPGTYHLQVQAFNEDGVPSEIKKLTLIFKPKWYQTRGFNLLLILVAIAIVYFIYRVRINQLKKEQRIEQLIRSKLASDLHDDLGSTMNSVKVYANLALMDRRDEYLFKIKESIQEAITGIRDMIWVLDDRKDSIEDLLSRISQFASPLSEANGILYKPEMTDEARSHKLGQEERRNLYMILKEAVNNTIKYADAKKIDMEVSIKKGKPAIRLTDNGKGFETKAASEGNGLKNMYRRAKEIKYQISILSEAGGGTKIFLQKF